MQSLTMRPRPPALCRNFSVPAKSKFDTIKALQEGH
jgi:hypothetical protein